MHKGGRGLATPCQHKIMEVKPMSRLHLTQAVLATHPQVELLPVRPLWSELIQPKRTEDQRKDQYP